MTSGTAVTLCCVFRSATGMSFTVIQYHASKTGAVATLKQFSQLTVVLFDVCSTSLRNDASAAFARP